MKKLKKPISLITTFAILIGVMGVMSTSISAFNIKTFNITWNIANGVSLPGTIITPLNQGDFLEVSLTITYSATLAGDIDIGIVNAATNVFTSVGFYVSRSSQRITTRVLRVPQNGNYRFAIRNRVGVPITVTGTYRYEKPSDTYHSFAALANRTVTIQTIREANVTTADWNNIWLPAIRDARDSWHFANAGVNITTTTNSSSHTLRVDSFLANWDGYYAPSAVSSIIFINTAGSANLGGTCTVQRQLLRRAVIAHEIGHLFFLGENPTPTNQHSIMRYSSYYGGYIATPQLFDANNVRFRYE